MCWQIFSLTDILGQQIRLGYPAFAFMSAGIIREGEQGLLA
jgi:hypothetical protein